MEEELKYTEVEIDEINIKELIYRYLKNWKWFLLSIIVCVGLGYTYLSYQVPQYEASAKILIKDEKNGGSIIDESSVFEDLGLLKGGKNIDNEIEVLKSRSLMISAVKSLHANIFYYSYGRPIYHEKFKDTPIEVNCLNSDTNNCNQGMGNWIIYPLNNSKFQLSNAGTKAILGEFYFGQTIQTPEGKLRFNSTKYFNSSLLNKPFKVNILPIETAANLYLKNLEVSPVNKTASVLNISLKCPIPIKAVEIVNRIIKQHDLEEIEDKDIVSKNTSEFISERIKFISQELGEVENDVENYKKNNKLTDITSESELFLQSGNESEKKIIELGSQLKLVEFMLEDLTKRNNPMQLIPSNLGLQDMSIANLISEYNKIILESGRMVKNSGVKNPLVENYQKQISELKTSIKESLENLKNTLEINIAELNKRESLINNRIASVPKFEREFRNIFRQQQIKETLYLYLLQKREETNITLAGKVSNTKIIDPAFSSGAMISPKKNVVYSSMFFLGFILPFIVIYIKDLLDTKVQSKLDLDKYRIPQLGDIPISDGSNPFINQDNNSVHSEYYRSLRTNVRFLCEASTNKSKVVFITSTISKEGKTYISINLSTSFALSDKKTLLIGFDLRHPKIAEYLNLNEKKGITNFLIDKSSRIEDFIIKKNDDNLLFDVLLSGPIPPNPSELLMHKKIEAIFNYARENYDYILVDTAPVGLVADTLLLNEFADCSVYVVKANYLDKRMLHIANDLNKSKRLTNIAFLLNGRDTSAISYGYGYGYGYSYYNETPKVSFIKRVKKMLSS
ncbi:MAG: polysaccharide biosynthesis tyrosine autokinase [Bacteroidota bacterium]|jgi:capsular exopolysaccharide synthesis family protein